MNAPSQLLKAIMQAFKIESNVFIEAQITDTIKELDKNEYTSFFRQLCGNDDEFKFKGPLDRVEIVSKRFKAKDELPLIEQRKNEAEELLNSLYAKSNSCMKYVDNHRDKFPTDKDFFMEMDFAALYVFHSLEDFFTKRETYVINKLGREWFMNMTNRTQPDLIRQIESVIKEAQAQKALGSGEKKVMEMIKCV